LCFRFATFLLEFWPGAAGANAQSLHTGNFGKLWTFFADGHIVAQPLYVANLAIDTPTKPGIAPVKGTFNAVIIATMHNTVYAYDADKARRGPNGQTIPLWATWLGKPRLDSGDIDMWSTNYPEWGIVSTPVVSDDRKTLYVVAWHNDGSEGLRYKLHALDLATGAERRSAVIRISSTDKSKPCNSAQSEFNPCQQKQRSSQLLSNGVLYVGFGGDGNRGALIAFDAASFTEKATDHRRWQTGRLVCLVADQHEALRGRSEGVRL
jgi:outer membrane protein assembly factor BamB